MKNSNVKTEKKELTNDVNLLVKESKNLLSDSQLLKSDFKDLDNINLDILSKELAKNIKAKTNNKEKIYKIKADKKERQILRKKRNTFFDNIIFYFANKMQTELKKEIESFNKFYKETYLLNDYSVNSICQNNSDKETIIKAKTFLQIVLKNK